MFDKKRFLILIISCISIILLIWFLEKKIEKKTEEITIVYTDNVKLFSGFNMTKDMNRINGVKIDEQKNKLDSLYVFYRIFKQSKNSVKLKYIETKLAKEDEELRYMGEKFSKDVSEKVWKRLNAYIKTYGEQNNYMLILGTQGHGNVMYANDKIDITEGLLEYANGKYEGN
ncbi:MAG: OmpH family outer membrane protein [Cellulophaga sp.]